MGYEDATAGRQSWFLDEVLAHLGIDVTQHKKELRRLAGDYHNCTRMAELQARLLVEHWPGITSKVDGWSKGIVPLS